MVLEHGAYKKEKRSPKRKNNMPEEISTVNRYRRTYPRNLHLIFFPKSIRQPKLKTLYLEWLLCLLLGKHLVKKKVVCLIHNMCALFVRPCVKVSLVNNK